MKRRAFKRYFKLIIGVSLCGLYASFVQAAGQSGTQVKGIRLWQAPDSTRIVFDVNKPIAYRVTVQESTKQLIIELPRAYAGFPLNKLSLGATSQVIRRVYQAQGKTPDELRVVFELTKDLQPRSFTLPPIQQYGHRLVIDLYPKVVAQVKTVAPQPSPANSIAAKTITPPNKPLPGLGKAPALKQPASVSPKTLVIAVDAGHGGEDPGAIGNLGTQEKQVTLSIARQLAKMINREPGMRAVLVRDGDYAVALHDRPKIARQYGADMFVSIHADSFMRAEANGASVWVLSPKGAHSEVGRWLEQREKHSDLLGGVGSINLKDKEPMLAEVLLDLSMTHVMDASSDVAAHVLRQLGRVSRLHKQEVQQAGFRVLKSPDIPSILVETAFISNPQEERKLASVQHQQGIARAVLAGVRTYFSKQLPAQQRLAEQKPSPPPAPKQPAATRSSQQAELALRDR